MACRLAGVLRGQPASRGSEGRAVPAGSGRSARRGLEAGQQCLYLLVDLVAERPHPLQIITWESELPVLVLGGAWRQGWAGRVSAHGDDQLGGGQQLGGDRLGGDAGQACIDICQSSSGGQMTVELRPCPPSGLLGLLVGDLEQS